MSLSCPLLRRGGGAGGGGGSKDMGMQAHLGGRKTDISCGLRQEQANMDDLDLKRKPGKAEPRTDPD